MGINLVWECPVHKRYHTSLRGEEGIDFQYFVRDHRGCPDQCLRNGNIRVWHDGYFVKDDEYTEMFPNWNDRPAEREKQGRI